MRRKLLAILTVTLVALCLMSCQTSQQEAKKEIIDYTSDIVFPAFPPVRANKVEDLTEKEYLDIMIYMIKCESVFDIIAEREKALGIK